MKTRAGLWAVVGVAAVLVLAGCAPEQDSDATPTPSTTADASATPTATPLPDPTESSKPAVTLPTAENISCDTMLDPLVDKALRSTQLTPFGKEWTQFNFEPTGAALECPWGYEGEPHAVSYFAWAALTEGEAEKFLALTAENGYSTRVDERGTWVVGREGEPNEVSGILVTDEWIAFAPTPDLISAIVWTR